MEHLVWIDQFPLVVLFIAVILTCFAAMEVGYRLGLYRRNQASREKAEPVGPVVGSILALLAFVLAFTFGMAGSRYDDRKAALLEEANAIGTAYLRTELVPAALQEPVRALLREYVDVRLKVQQDIDYLPQAIARSKEIHAALWARTVEIANQYPPSVNHSLFIQAINDVIDLHEKRMAVAIYNRIPESIWLALYLVSILAMAATGFQSGLAGSRRTMTAIFLTLTFSCILLLIAVLDRPESAKSIVSQRVLVDLQMEMKKNTSFNERK